MVMYGYSLLQNKKTFYKSEKTFTKFYFNFICNLDMLTLISPSFQYQLALTLQIIGQCDSKHNYDVSNENYNVSFEGVDIHYRQYHTSYMSRWYSSDNVCLDLHKCRYSICIQIQSSIDIYDKQKIHLYFSSLCLWGLLF